MVPHFLNLVYTKNAGAAFGLFSESPSAWRTVLLIVVSSLLLAMVIGVVWRNQQLRRVAGVGLALILGGALSNLFDRIRFGRVVDFVDVYYRGYHWYTFNLADASIVVGAGFLCLSCYFWIDGWRCSRTTADFLCHSERSEESPQSVRTGGCRDASLRMTSHGFKRCPKSVNT